MTDIEEVPNVGIISIPRGRETDDEKENDACHQHEYQNEDSWLTLNIGGMTFKTQWSTIQRYPRTLLGGLTTKSDYYKSSTKEFVFDRNPFIFQCILDFYRLGHLHFPTYMCGPVIQEEIEFWQIKETRIAPCCWSHYVEFSEKEETLNTLGNAFNTIDTFDELPDGALMKRTKVLRKVQSIREKIWYFMEDPSYNIGAQIKAMIYVILILFSILSLAIDTHPDFRVPSSISRLMDMNETNPKVILQATTNSHPSIYYGEFIITCCFAVDIIIRLIVCPHKAKFLLNFFNFLDIVVVVSQWTVIVIALQDDFEENAELQRIYWIFSCFRICRVFLVFKLAKHYAGLKVLILALKASSKELMMLATFMVIGMVLFATLVYYAEFHEARQYPNIPEAFWWALITMTTVGYGDAYPITPFGYLVGALCAVAGMITMGLPIPIIANNFNLYYTVAGMKKTMDKMKAKRAAESEAEAEEIPSTVELPESGENGQVLGEASNDESPLNPEVSGKGKRYQFPEESEGTSLKA